MKTKEAKEALKKKQWSFFLGTIADSTMALWITQFVPIDLARYGFD